MISLRSNIYFIILLFFLYVVSLCTAPKVFPVGSPDSNNNLNNTDYELNIPDDELNDPDDVLNNLNNNNNPSDAETDLSNEEKDMKTCRDLMRSYCDRSAYEEDPTALDCVKSFIFYFDDTTLPDGIIKDYYLSFIEHPESLRILSRKVLSPENFCNQPYTNVEKCRNDLKDFKETKEQALEFALYKTLLKVYGEMVFVPAHWDDNGNWNEARWVDTVYNMYGERYMRHIYLKVSLDLNAIEETEEEYVIGHWTMGSNDYIIQDPMDFCREKCYDSNREWPLTWSQYQS